LEHLGRHHHPIRVLREEFLLHRGQLLDHDSDGCMLPWAPQRSRRRSR
jgi:hypothetical protein